MYKKIYSKFMLLIAIMLLGAGSTWAQNVTYDIADASWTVSDGALTNGEISFVGEGPDNFKKNNGYFMMGKSGAYINFPTYEKAVEKIVVTGNSAASASTVMNIFVGDNAVSSATTGSKKTNTYEIDADYQAAGTQYTLKVTSAHNAQITKIEVYFVSEAGVAKPTFSPEAGTYSEAQNVTISCATSGTTIYYTLDGTDPTDQSTVYTDAINVSETTTIKAIAYDATGASSAIASATYTIETISGDEHWQLTDLSNLTPNDVFVIVGNNGSNYAMTNNNGTGSAPSAVEVTVDNNFITSTVSDNIKWSISGNATNGYTFHPFGSNGTWLYCTNSNNGVRVGTNDDKVFEIKDKYLYHTATSRYVGIYSSQDWRCYTSINANIKDQTFAFYKKVTEEEAQEPSISAENVSIAYDATEGTISYTLNNPVDGGKLSAATNANWLTIGTVGDETISFTTTANDAADEREATVTLTYSYDNKAVTKDVTVLQAGNPNIVMTIAEVRAQATGDVVTKGVVTSCVGKTAYIQDETAAICVYGSSNLGLNKGEEVKVSGSLSTYNGLLEIASPTCEVLSSDNNVTATVKTIEEINNDYAEGNTLQGLLVKIENATVTEINGQNTTIAQGANTIVVRGISSDVEYAVDDVLTLTGNIGCYNAAQIANPTDVEVQEVETAKYYLAGSWDNGSWQNGMVEFENKGNGVYTLTKALEANTEFKVVDENNNWYSAETPDLTKPCESIALSSSNQDNMKIELAGNYTFRLDVTANGTFLTVEGWPEAGYYLVGSWGELPWTAIESNKFAESEEGGIYTINKTLAGGETFKVLYVNDNAKPTWYGGDTQGANPPYVIHSEHHEVVLTAGNAGSDFAIYEAGNYTFTLNATGTESTTLNVTGWEEPIEGKAFVKVTSTDDITNGQYLIVYEDANIAFDGSLETLDAVGNTLDVTIVGDKIAATEETLASVFTVDVNNGTLKSASGKYIGVSSNSNALNTSDNASTYTHSFSIDDEGNAVIAAVFEGSTMTLRFNSASNQARFRYYKSGQQAIQLYKYNVPTVTIGAAEWATYVAVDNVEFPEGVTAYVPVQVNEGHTAVMIQSVNAVKKGEPVILNGEAGTYELSIAETEPAEVKNIFVVSNGTDVSDGTYYMLSYKNETVGFRKVQEGVTIPAGKPYIVIVNAAKDFIPFGGGEATGIESFETVGFDVNAPIYDMQGRQVQKLQKGIFIQNGKKLIVK